MVIARRARRFSTDGSGSESGGNQFTTSPRRRRQSSEDASTSAGLGRSSLSASEDQLACENLELQEEVEQQKRVVRQLLRRVERLEEELQLRAAERVPSKDRRILRGSNTQWTKGFADRARELGQELEAEMKSREAIETELATSADRLKLEGCTNTTLAFELELIREHCRAHDEELVTLRRALTQAKQDAQEDREHKQAEIDRLQEEVHSMHSMLSDFRSSTVSPSCPRASSSFLHGRGYLDLGAEGSGCRPSIVVEAAEENADEDGVSVDGAARAQNPRREMRRELRLEFQDLEAHCEALRRQLQVATAGYQATQIKLSHSRTRFEALEACGAEQQSALSALQAEREKLRSEAAADVAGALRAEVGRLEREKEELLAATEKALQRTAKLQAQLEAGQRVSATGARNRLAVSSALAAVPGRRSLEAKTADAPPSPPAVLEEKTRAEAQVSALQAEKDTVQRAVDELRRQIQAQGGLVQQRHALRRELAVSRKAASEYSAQANMGIFDRLGLQFLCASGDRALGGGGSSAGDVVSSSSASGVPPASNASVSAGVFGVSFAAEAPPVDSAPTPESSPNSSRSVTPRTHGTFALRLAGTPDAPD